MEDNMLLDEVVVIITTRNRLSELLKTIDKCIEIGLRQEQLFITDDASTDGTPQTVRKLYPGVVIHVNIEKSGLIHNRNFMMKRSQGNYILSLDDDSNLLSKEDLEEAISLLASKDEYGVFGFTPVEQIAPPVSSRFSNEIFISKWYIGCGHIIKRETFNKIGPYREEFIFYGEEIDFSARCFQQELFVVRKMNLVVHHRVDYSNRNKLIKADDNKGEYGILWRNEFSLANRLTHILLYFPLASLPYYFAKSLVGHFYIYCLQNKWGSSYWRALSRVYKRRDYIKNERTPFSSKQFKQYLQLK